MIGNRDPSVFLVEQMVKDLTNLSKILGKSIDDATMIMHEIFKRMRLATVSCQLSVMMRFCFLHLGII